MKHFYTIILICVAMLIFSSCKSRENFVPDSNWRDRVTSYDTERCVKDIINSQFNYREINNSSNTLLKEALAADYVRNAGLAMQAVISEKPDADALFIAAALIKTSYNLEENIYTYSKGKYKCNMPNLSDYEVKEFYGSDQRLPNVFKEFVFRFNRNPFSKLDKDQAETLSTYAYLAMLSMAYAKFIDDAGYNHLIKAQQQQKELEEKMKKQEELEKRLKELEALNAAEKAAADAKAKQAQAAAEKAAADAKAKQAQAAPTPAQNSNDSLDTQANLIASMEKQCDIQNISKEKQLPKWNIEIIDSSVIASMLKDAEKNHLPFLKINASDDLNQKLEGYINKDPSKLNPDFKNAFTCTLGNYIRTSSNIGIQLVYCKDFGSNEVTFLNLVSPVDNKARVYKAKIFDNQSYIESDFPVIVKTEETVINGERGVYVAVKYNTGHEATGTDWNNLEIVHYLFLGDKLRYLTDWDAFNIVEDWAHDDDTEEYSCNAKTTVLRLESSGAKQQEHTFSISTSN